MPMWFDGKSSSLSILIVAHIHSKEAVELNRMDNRDQARVN